MLHFRSIWSSLSSEQVSRDASQGHFILQRDASFPPLPASSLNDHGVRPGARAAVQLLIRGKDIRLGFGEKSDEFN
jgi:hypothetical protein